MRKNEGRLINNTVHDSIRAFIDMCVTVNKRYPEIIHPLWYSVIVPVQGAIETRMS